MKIEKNNDYSLTKKHFINLLTSVFSFEKNRIDALYLVDKIIRTKVKDKLIMGKWDYIKIKKINGYRDLLNLYKKVIKFVKFEFRQNLRIEKYTKKIKNKKFNNYKMLNKKYTKSRVIKIRGNPVYIVNRNYDERFTYAFQHYSNYNFEKIIKEFVLSWNINFPSDKLKINKDFKKFSKDYHDAFMRF